MVAYRMLGASGGPDRRHGVCQSTQLIGRETVLCKAVEMLKDASTPVQLVNITGQAGIGELSQWPS